MTSNDGPKEKHFWRVVCREKWGSKEAMMEAKAVLWRTMERF